LIGAKSKSMKNLSCNLSQPDRGTADAVVNPIANVGSSRGQMGRLKLVEALERLPLIERAAVFFRDIEKLSLDVVASELRCSVREARLHIAHGRIKLLRQIRPSARYRPECPRQNSATAAEGLKPQPVKTARNWFRVKYGTPEGLEAAERPYPPFRRAP
jgi:hypothetical protein